MEVFKEVQTSILESKKKHTILTKLKPEIERLGSISFFRTAFQKAKKAILDRRDLPTIVNPDLTFQHFMQQKPKERQNIEEQFRTNPDMPVLLYFQDLNERWVLSDKYSITYNFIIKGRNLMEVMQIDV